MEGPAFPRERGSRLVRPILPIFLRRPNPLVIGSVDVDGNALQTCRRGYEHEPSPFILDKIQEIILTIRFKLQFIFSLDDPKS